MVVAQGLVVSLEYTLRLDSEEIIDSTEGKAPLTYTHGAQEIITGLEKELEGMAVGERKQVTVSPSDGYGEVHPEGRFEVAKDRVPVEALRIGATLQGEGPDGKPVACIEKLKVLGENLEEIRQLAQDSLEDAVLMGCDEAQFREVLRDLVARLDNPYRRARRN